MKLSLALPPNLLERVQGVEAGLKKGKKVEKAGWGAFIVSVGTVGLAAVNNRSNLEGLPLIGDSPALWPVIIVVAVIVICVMLINWTRIWVRASRKPFRYTYSIAEFKAIEGSARLAQTAPAAAGTEETDAGVEPTDEGLEADG